MKTDWKKGDTCYVVDSTSDSSVMAEITDICYVGVGDAFKYPEIKYTNSRGEKVQSPTAFNMIFPTYKDCQRFLDTEDEYIKSKYRKKIKTVKDLVKFMYKHPVSKKSEGRTNLLAREVVREKAKELLDLNLKV